MAYAQQLGQHLCQRCSNIDFKTYLYVPIETERKIKLCKVRDLGSGCPFCRLVLASLPNRYVRPEAVIWLGNRLATTSTHVYALAERSTRSGYSNRKDIEAIAKATAGKKRYQFTLHVDGNLYGIVQHFPRVARSFFGRLIDPNRVDIDLVKTWFDCCRQQHTRSCEEAGAASKRLSFFRVIDIARREVIPAPAGCSYIALSYVWGNHPFFKITTELLHDATGRRARIALPTRLPQTIEDAMSVTTALGEQFLWVDALCILQDDPEELHCLMRRMDAIYSSATLTIVAGSGDSAFSGIPGLSRPRSAQVVEMVDDVRLGLALSTYIEMEEDPYLRWNQRGWTLQEKILSKRLLICTEEQVYYQCSNTAWWEDLVVDPALSRANPYRFRPLRWAPDRSIGESNIKNFNVKWQVYAALVEGYTRRQLSHPKDGVNAIQGVLTTMEPTIGSFLFGLPTTYLDLALVWEPALWSRVMLWSPDDVPLPSWSWGRWSLPDGCTWPLPELMRRGSHLKTMESFYVIFDSRNPFPTPSGKRSRSDCNDIMPSMRSLNTGKVYRRSPSTPSIQRALVRVGALLYFKRISLNYGLNIRPGRFYLGNTEQTHILEDGLMLQCVGYFNISPAAQRDYAINRSRYSLITLSVFVGYSGPPISADYVRRVSDGTDSDGNTRYRYERPDEYETVALMLVKWTQDVAERVAVGRIVKTAWDRFKAKPNWVVLA